MLSHFVFAAFPAVENVVIIGSGPAGYTAAIYAGRASLGPMVLEGFSVKTCICIVTEELFSPVVDFALLSHY